MCNYINAITCYSAGVAKIKVVDCINYCWLPSVVMNTTPNWYVLAFPYFSPIEPNYYSNGYWVRRGSAKTFPLLPTSGPVLCWQLQPSLHFLCILAARLNWPILFSSPPDLHNSQIHHLLFRFFFSYFYTALGINDHSPRIKLCFYLSFQSLYSFFMTTWE